MNSFHAAARIVLSLALAFSWCTLAVAESPENPLTPVIAKMQAALEHIDARIKDYSATFIKRERVDGDLVGPDIIFTKVRHKPLSVYMHFIGPEKKKGREVVYVQGANDGKLIVRPGPGPFGLVVPPLRLDPEGTLAMRGNRHPITSFGVRTLCVRLLEVFENDKQQPDCEVTSYKNAKVAGRACTCMQILHPARLPNLQFHVARIYFDDGLKIPIRFEAYDWPKRPGGRLQLIEEYTYTNLKPNLELADADFK